MQGNAGDSVMNSSNGDEKVLFEYETTDNFESLSTEELEKLLAEKESLAKRYYNMEQSVKLTLNSIYGAFGNQHFYFYNINLAETITLQGQDAILYTEALINKYFHETWHTDTELHASMGIKVTGKVLKPIGVYIDTDSIQKEAKIKTDKGEFSVEEWYNINIKNGSGGETMTGHESVLTNDKILNFNDSELYYANVKRIIRHKVKKDKWKLKTKSGKEIDVTGDHSLIVFRKGDKKIIKARDINILTDKILSIYNE